MIHFEPFPLLEAVFFLANRTAEVSWTSFLDTTFGSSGQRSDLCFPHHNRAGAQTQRQHHGLRAHPAEAICPPAAQRKASAATSF